MTDKITEQPEARRGTSGGFIRAIVEHYDDKRDVEQDPHGAWLVIQIQATRIKLLEAERDTIKAKLEAAVEALTPSGDTKASYMGEFSFPITLYHPELGEETRRVSVPWTCIKEIMAMIRARATLAKIKGEA